MKFAPLLSVWAFGSCGSGNLVALEGAPAVRAGDIVVVTVNHRLGALGYLDLSAAGAMPTAN